MRILLQQKGIENLFPEELFDTSFVTTTITDGNTKTFFNENKKKQFEQMIMTRNNESDFEKFSSLIEKINKIKNDV